jgi:hypothetical protein
MQTHSSFEKSVWEYINIDKMRVVCLLEVDYNWLNDYVFAKQIMDKALSIGIVFVEQLAKWGSQAFY